MQVTRSYDIIVEKAQVWEWRGQLFEFQARQVNITLFVSNMPKRKWTFEIDLSFLFTLFLFSVYAIQTSGNKALGEDYMYILANL